MSAQVFPGAEWRMDWIVFCRSAGNSDSFQTCWYTKSKYIREQRYIWDEWGGLLSTTTMNVQRHTHKWVEDITRISRKHVECVCLYCAQHMSKDSVALENMSTKIKRSSQDSWLTVNSWRDRDFNELQQGTLGILWWPSGGLCTENGAKYSAVKPMFWSSSDQLENSRKPLLVARSTKKDKYRSVSGSESHHSAPAAIINLRWWLQG